MPNDTLTWLMFSVNLTFIVTNLYGWLLKRFFVPEAYKENFKEKKCECCGLTLS